MRGQVLTIALLVAAGVTVLMLCEHLRVARTTQETYYRDSRFADLWADMKRAPQERARPASRD